MNARRALDSVTHFFSEAWIGVSNAATSLQSHKQPEHKIGDLYADYTMPTEAEIAALNAETEEFLKNCKPVSR
jgi:hypothetical protein